MMMIMCIDYHTSAFCSKKRSQASFSLLARREPASLPLLSTNLYMYSPLLMPSSITFCSFSFLQLFWSRYSLYLQEGHCSMNRRSVKCRMQSQAIRYTTSLVASQLNSVSMQMAPIRLSNTSPSTFSEPILSLLNSSGLGSLLTSLLMALNSRMVESMSSRSIMMRSWRLSWRAMKPSDLLLTADCLRKERVPSSVMWSPPLSQRYSTTSRSSTASPRNSSRSQKISCFLSLYCLSMVFSARRLRVLESLWREALMSSEKLSSFSMTSSMQVRKLGWVMACMSSPLFLNLYWMRFSSFMYSSGRGQLLLWWVNSRQRVGLLRMPKAQRRVWQSLRLLLLRQKIPISASITSACTLPGMYWKPSSSSCGPSRGILVLWYLPGSSFLILCSSFSYLTRGTGSVRVRVVKMYWNSLFLMAALCRLALQMRLALAMCISPSSQSVRSRKIWMVASSLSTTSPMNSNSSQLSFLWCLQILEVRARRMSSIFSCCSRSRLTLVVGALSSIEKVRSMMSERPKMLEEDWLADWLRDTFCSGWWMLDMSRLKDLPSLRLRLRMLPWLRLMRQLLPRSRRYLLLPPLVRELKRGSALSRMTLGQYLQAQWVKEAILVLSGPMMSVRQYFRKQSAMQWSSRVGKTYLLASATRSMVGYDTGNSTNSFRKWKIPFSSFSFLILRSLLRNSPKSSLAPIFHSSIFTSSSLYMSLFSRQCWYIFRIFSNLFLSLFFFLFSSAASISLLQMVTGDSLSAPPSRQPLWKHMSLWIDWTRQRLCFRSLKEYLLLLATLSCSFSSSLFRFSSNILSQMKRAGLLWQRQTRFISSWCLNTFWVAFWSIPHSFSPLRISTSTGQYRRVSSILMATFFLSWVSQLGETTAGDPHSQLQQSTSLFFSALSRNLCTSLSCSYSSPVSSTSRCTSFSSKVSPLSGSKPCFRPANISLVSYGSKQVSRPISLTPSISLSRLNFALFSNFT